LGEELGGCGAVGGVGREEVDGEVDGGIEVLVKGEIETGVEGVGRPIKGDAEGVWFGGSHGDCGG